MYLWFGKESINMKKILFSAVSLDVGGIETALVTLLNHLANEKENEEYKYEITLFLEKKEGIFLNEIDERIQIKEYVPSKLKLALIRKLINFIKQTMLRIKYKEKFDFSCAYATYSKPASFVARNGSKNSCLWIHLDYLEFFNNNKNEVIKFFEGIKLKEFQHIVCVSEKCKESFLKVFPYEESKTIHINNLINYKKIIKMSNEKIDNKFENKNIVTFINIGRQEEGQKRLSRLIKACDLLQKDDATKGKFRLVLIGDGIDSAKYKEMIKTYGLEKNIEMLGKKKNPYPYLKMSDCLVLCSSYEGYPVVYVESMVLNKPIITTYVSGTKEVQDENYDVMVVQHNEQDLFVAMKNFIKGNEEKKSTEFDPEKYNKDIMKKLEKMI